MINTNVTTIYYNELLMRAIVGEQYLPDTNNTLNTRFGVMTTTVPDNDRRHDTVCIAIGNGGHKSDVLQNAIENVVVHKPEDVSLYSFIPFIIRPLNNDITDTERQSYRFRTLHTINGEDYVAYYLKVVQLPETTTTISNYSSDLEESSSSEFTPSPDNINPTPVTKEVGAYTYNIRRYESSRLNLITLSNTEIDEIKNSCVILFGSEDYAIVSEVSTYIGMNTLTTGTTIDSGGNPDSVTYNELMSTIPLMFTSVLYDTTISSGPLSFYSGISSGIVQGV